MNFAGKPGGRIVIELYGEKCPFATYNFLHLCTGEEGVGMSGNSLNFVTTSIHYIKKDIGIYGGDLGNQNGAVTDSIYGELFEDEALGEEHNEDGLVYMVNNGKNTNGSQFLITPYHNKDINDSSVCVGYVLNGLVVVKKMLHDQEKDGPPRIAYDIARCGKLNEEGKIPGYVVNEEAVQKVDKPCFDFLQGHCSKGDKCPFQHIVVFFYLYYFRLLILHNNQQLLIHYKLQQLHQQQEQHQVIIIIHYIMVHLQHYQIFKIH